MEKRERTVLKNGLLIDPANGIEDMMEIAMEGDRIVKTGVHLDVEKEDRVIDCSGMEIWPGLIDMHLHVSDLFEIHTNTAYGAVQDGVTTALSPGAGNTFMAPALLGAEMDRGLPLNTGVFVGAANVLGTMLNTEELIRLFNGTLEKEAKERKLSKNEIVNRTAQYVIGIKEHMGHFLLPDEKIEQIFEITDQAHLMFLTHTQDVRHTARLLELAKGRHLHLGHANAAGCGTHGDAVASMKEIIDFCRNENVTGEFVTTMLRLSGGCREGLRMYPKAREIALEALADGVVDILVSDGQNQSVMKGFGDTRDNIPCILELTEMGILKRKEAVALMTANPARLLTRQTSNEEWLARFGHAGEGAYASLLVVEPKTKHASYVFTNGILTSFEQRYLRLAGRAGYWVSKFETKQDMGIGDMAVFQKV
ncbi:amidohydrolase family protein [Roseburia hominis]